MSPVVGQQEVSIDRERLVRIDEAATTVRRDRPERQGRIEPDEIISRVPSPEASPHSRSSSVRVVLFSGGRGSGALTRQLVKLPNVSLTVAINGYDDGASTGEIRRFLGDALGPSDFRKNASRIATERSRCAARR